MGEDNKYRLEGTFSINDEEKKQEMNNLILEILRKTGICRLTTKKVGNTKIPVVAKAVPNKNGIVQFDYSIYEKKQRKGNYYDINSCKLVTHDIGLNHFGLTMIIIMSVLEAYSDTPCFLVYIDRLAEVCDLAEIVEELTGKRLYFDRRAQVFDTLVYFKQLKKYEKFIYRAFPFGYCHGDRGQYVFTVTVLNEPISQPGEGDSKLDIDNKLAFLCLELLRTNKDLKAQALEYISKLMDMTLEERKKESEKKHQLDFISGVATYLPGAYLVKIYAEAFEEEFFDIWFQIGKEGYWDVMDFRELNFSKSSHPNNHSLSTLYKMDNEDEFIGLWTGDEIILSDQMKMDLEEYKKRYNELDDNSVTNYEMLSNLVSCVDDLQTFWGSMKYIDKNMLEEFIAHKDDIRYKKAVLVLRSFINDEIEMFPEFTESQVRKWILMRVDRRRIADKYWHYIDVLSNIERRNELLGF